MDSKNEQLSASTSSKKPKPSSTRRWGREIAKAQEALAANARALDDSAPAGLASDDTLRARGYVATAGEKLPKQRIGQPLREPVLHGTKVR